MIRIIYTITLKNEYGETQSHDFFDYTAGWDFARRECADYHNACGGNLTVDVDWNWKETADREYAIKPTGEILWED